MKAAVRELEQEYEGKVEVTVFDMSTPDGKAEGQKYDWGEKMHGLVGYDAQGKRAVLVAGHDYGKDRVREAFEETLR